MYIPETFQFPTVLLRLLIVSSSHCCSNRYCCYHYWHICSREIVLAIGSVLVFINPITAPCAGRSVSWHENKQSFPLYRSSSWGSLRASRFYGCDPRKSPLLPISRFQRYCGPSNYRFNFLLYWYAPWVFFEVVNVLSCSPFMIENTENIRWIVVYTVCASAVISTSRQWLDSYAKTRLKMWHTFKHFIHMQYFLLPTNLVIVFVHWVSTSVLYKPRQCSLFWDYIPESKLCFCLNLCRPPGANSIRPIQKLLNCQQRDDARWLWVREITWYLYTRGVRGRMKAKQRWFKVIENCVMNGFIIFGIMFMTATGLENSPQSFGVFTVSQSRSVVTSAENPAPDNSPRSIGELRNGHVASLQGLYYTRLVRKMAWYKILIHVLIV